MTTYYLGKITKIIDRLTYEVRVSIDGIVDEKPAFPFRGELDEPMVGDFVICKSIDPVYQSMYLYQKLKEDEFIGFRSNGKAIDVTPDYIEMRVYNFDEARDGQTAHDESESFISRVRIEKSGDIRITTAKGNVYLDIDGNVEQKITGDVNETVEGNVNSTIKGDMTSLVEGTSNNTTKGDIYMTAEGNVDVDIQGETTLTCPSTIIKGPGTLKVNAASVIPKAAGGPFCTFKVAPPAGTPMVTGDTIILKS